MYTFISISLAILTLFCELHKILSELTSVCAAEQVDSVGKAPDF